MGEAREGARLERGLTPACAQPNCPGALPHTRAPCERVSDTPVASSAPAPRPLRYDSDTTDLRPTPALQNALAKFLLFSGGQGFRERLLGDPLFLVKLGIELGVGLCTKARLFLTPHSPSPTSPIPSPDPFPYPTPPPLQPSRSLPQLTAEKTKRGKDFAKEADFVLANVLMALLADFALTWLPAPTLPLSPRLASASGLQRFLQACPDNAFQIATGAPAERAGRDAPSPHPLLKKLSPDTCLHPHRLSDTLPAPVSTRFHPHPASRKFTFLQRTAAIVRNGAKLFAVGTGASIVGTGVTNGIVAVKTAIDPSLKKETEDMNIVRSIGCSITAEICNPSVNHPQWTSIQRHTHLACVLPACSRCPRPNSFVQVTQSLAYGLYMSVSSNLRYQARTHGGTSHPHCFDGVAAPQTNPCALRSTEARPRSA